MYPCNVYHRQQGAQLVASEQDRLALGPGWHFDPSHCPADDPPAAQDEPEAEDDGIPDFMAQPATRRRGRPPKAR